VDKAWCVELGGVYRSRVLLAKRVKGSGKRGDECADEWNKEEKKVK
jgi:hypothetical protein